jgi:hypothetical protein
VRAGSGEAWARNDDCAHFCTALCGHEDGCHGGCTSQGAHHTGPCYQCGPNGGTNALCAALTIPGPCACPSRQGGYCTDTASDSANCAGCGNVCPSGTFCCGGKCIPNCSAVDQCHGAGVCNPSTQSCTNPTKPDGTACNARTCTTGDTCMSGACTSSGATACSSGQCCSNGTCVNMGSAACGCCNNGICVASCRSGQCCNLGTCSPIGPGGCLQADDTCGLTGSGVGGTCLGPGSTCVTQGSAGCACCDISGLCLDSCASDQCCSNGICQPIGPGGCLKSDGTCGLTGSGVGGTCLGPGLTCVTQGSAGCACCDINGICVASCPSGQSCIGGICT